MSEEDAEVVAETFQRLKAKEGLLQAATYIHNAISRLFASGAVSVGISLAKDLIATYRCEILQVPLLCRRRILRKCQDALISWQSALSSFPSDLYYMWMVFYNTAADAAKEQGDYVGALETLQKAERLIRERGYSADKDVLVAVAYTEVNLATLSLAAQQCERAIGFAEECLSVVTKHLNLREMKAVDAERYAAVVNSYVLAYFNKAVALEFLGKKSHAMKTYQTCLSTAAQHSYTDAFLLEEAKFALSELHSAQFPAAISREPRREEGYYDEQTLIRLSDYLKKSSCPFFVSMQAYFSAKIHRELQLERDVEHMPVYTQNLRRKYSLLQAQDRRAVSTLRLRKTHKPLDRTTPARSQFFPGNP